MTKLEKFWSEIQKGITQLAEQSLNEYKEHALKDGLSFIEKGRDKISLWMMQLAAGEMKQDISSSILKRIFWR